MRLYLLIIILISTFVENTFAQKSEWAKQVGETFQGISNEIVTVDLENINTIGYFSGTVVFDASTGIYLIEILSNGKKAVLKIIKE